MWTKVFVVEKLWGTTHCDNIWLKIKYVLQWHIVTTIYAI